MPKSVPYKEILIAALFTAKFAKNAKLGRILTTTDEQLHVLCACPGAR